MSQMKFITSLIGGQWSSSVLTKQRPFALEVTENIICLAQSRLENGISKQSHAHAGILSALAGEHKGHGRILLRPNRFDG